MIALIIGIAISCVLFNVHPILGLAALVLTFILILGD